MQCFRGYSGPNCEVGLQQSQFAFFVIHLVIFLPSFTTFFVMSVLNTIAAVIMYKRKSGKVVDWTIILLFIFMIIGTLGATVLSPVWCRKRVPNPGVSFRVVSQTAFYG